MTDNKTQTLLEAALAYAARGWKVFPCRENDGAPYVNAKNETVTPLAKSPYIAEGYKGASADPAQIRRWWRKWPNAMIGLPAGDNDLLIVDFDPRVDPTTGEVFTLHTLKQATEEQIGAEIPASLVCITPSDGVHVYFDKPAGPRIGNRGNLPQHVDVRCDGGYVIVPPSVCEGGVKAAAGRYRWKEGREDSVPVAAPEALVAALRERGTRSTKKSAAGGTPASTSSSPSSAASPGPSDRSSAKLPDVGDAVRKYALAALDAECRELAGTPIGGGQYGGRNTGIYHAGLKMGSLVAAGAISEGVARAAIQDVIDRMPANDDPDGARTTLGNGLRDGKDNPRDLREIEEAARARAARSSGRSSAGLRPPPPSSTPAMQSSQEGGDGDDDDEEGAGERLARECAFLPQTDLGNLERFLKRYGRNFIYVEAWGWLFWDGRRWSREMAVAAFGRAVQDTMRAIQEEAKFIADSGVPPELLDMADEEAKAAHGREHAGKLDRVISVKRGVVTLLSDTIAKWGRTSEGAGHIKCIATMAEARLSSSPDKFDLDHLRVNVANGTLVFTRPEAGGRATVRMVKHRRKDLITRIATADYLPKATCEAYDSFLATVQPDADMRNFLDVWAGYNMLGDASAQKMAIFYGEGANGKGVWINTKRAILGDYAWAASIDSFTGGDRRRGGGDATPDLAALAGRRMVTANEAQEGSKFDDALVKELTSDEPKGGVRELLKPPFELQVTFKNTIICNNTPRIGTDHGIRRRIEIVPWPVIIPLEEQDLQLKAKLVKESSGILNRMVRGALAFLDGGLPVPEAIREATEKYLDENDILGRFLALCVERADGEIVGASALHELFAAWQTWAQLLPANGRPWSPKYLAQQMEKKRFSKRKSSSMVWDGITTLYQASDFLDSDGKPRVGDLPAARRASAPPAPEPDGYDPFNEPL